MKLAQNYLSIQDLSLMFCVILFENWYIFFSINSIDICDFLELLAHKESAMYIPCLFVCPAAMTLTFQFKFTRIFLEPHLELSDEILF